MDTPEKSWQMAGGVLGLICFNVFYFALALPPSQIGMPLLFWGAYTCWAAVGCIMLLRGEESQRAKTRRAIQVFILSIIVTSVLAAIDKVFLLTLLAFPGFYGGIALAGCMILTYRAATGKAPAKEGFLWPA
ncbi:MAG: hypothetical protein JRN20_21255 [Nitrososphaerota archaeon]|nr:hypothetical protein [Nitrososphaerota archaeon]